MNKKHLLMIAGGGGLLALLLLRGRSAAAPASSALVSSGAGVASAVRGSSLRALGAGSLGGDTLGCGDRRGLGSLGCGGTFR